MAIDVENTPLFQQRRATGAIIVRDQPKIDLETYIANYEGILRLHRLQTIARTSTLLSVDAFRSGISEARHGNNLELLQELQADFQKVLPNDDLAHIDSHTLQHADTRNRKQTERLEHELKGYKNNLIKESIRMGNEDLGNHYFDIGDLQNSQKAYTRMRESCTTPTHIAGMTLKQLYVAIVQRNWTLASSFGNKVTQLNMKEEEKERYSPILDACTGLAYMCHGQYRDAAKSFLSVKASYMTLGPQAGINFQKQIITPNDIAIYGGLCALATMDRADLESHVLENPDFRQFLELEPHIRRMITLFCSSKYSACISKLQEYTADYLLDMNLQDHFNDLVSLVRSKAIVQWFSTFSVVTFAELQRAFPSTTGGNIEDEMAAMIKKGMLDARIDLVDQLLISPNPDFRLSMVEDSLKMASQAEKTLLLRLHKINMQTSGLDVKKAGGGPQGQGQAGDERGERRSWRDLGKKGGTGGLLS